MRLLTLDLAKHTGWAAFDGVSSMPLTGCKTLVGWGYAPADFLELFRKWLGDMVLAHRPQAVAIERWFLPPHLDAATIGQQIGASYFAQWALRATGAEVYTPTSAEWRKETFGKVALAKGEDWKSKAVARVQARGFDVTNHNEAEAILQMDWLATKKRINLPWRTERLVA